MDGQGVSHKKEIEVMAIGWGTVEVVGGIRGGEGKTKIALRKN